MNQISWQEVSSIVAVLSLLVGGYINIYVKIKALEVEVHSLKTNEEKSEKKFDQIMDKLQQILIQLEKKQDK